MSKKPPKDDDQQMEDDSPPRRPKTPTPPNDPDGWNHLKEWGLIAHRPSACTTCGPYVAHVVEASMLREPSYLRANLEWDALHHRREDRLMQELGQLRRDIEEPRRENVNYAQSNSQLNKELLRERARSSHITAMAASRPTPYSQPPTVTTTRQRVGMAGRRRLHPRMQTQ
jgi:hypothetical protein